MKGKVKDLEGKIATLEQMVSSLSMAVNNKVDKDNVIAEINISEEGVRIKGEKIHLNNETLVDI